METETRAFKVRSTELRLFPSLEAESWQGQSRGELKSTQRCSECGCICGREVCRFCEVDKKEVAAKTTRKAKA